jgi:hypothetical protein
VQRRISLISLTVTLLLEISPAGYSAFYEFPAQDRFQGQACGISLAKKCW